MDSVGSLLVKNIEKAKKRKVTGQVGKELLLSAYAMNEQEDMDAAEKKIPKAARYR